MSLASVYPLFVAVGAAVGGAAVMASHKLRGALNDRQYMHEQPLFIQEDFTSWWALQLKAYTITKGSAAVPASSSEQTSSTVTG